ncbi:MAG: hypothetical protein M1837_007013 [Sclerophora amabilis]|nr:MAG: hypothetical protein M1837_007013 [Sclerophora amabilis]
MEARICHSRGGEGLAFMCMECEGIDIRVPDMPLGSLFCKGCRVKANNERLKEGRAREERARKERARKDRATENWARGDRVSEQRASEVRSKKHGAAEDTDSEDVQPQNKRITILRYAKNDQFRARTHSTTAGDNADQSFIKKEDKEKHMLDSLTSTSSQRSGLSGISHLQHVAGKHQQNSDFDKSVVHQPARELAPTISLNGTHLGHPKETIDIAGSQGQLRAILLADMEEKRTQATSRKTVLSSKAEKAAQGVAEAELSLERARLAEAKAQRDVGDATRDIEYIESLVKIIQSGTLPSVSAA